MTLDLLDIQLLNALQADNRQSAEALSAVVPLSPSAITRRLQRLRSGGAIAADTAVLSNAVTNGRVSAVIHVQLERHTPVAFADLRRALLDRDDVQWCAEVSGSFDLIVLVTTRSVEALTALVDEALSANPLVRRSETSLVKRRWKASFVVPLDERDAA